MESKRESRIGSCETFSASSNPKHRAVATAPRARRQAAPALQATLGRNVSAITRVANKTSRREWGLMHSEERKQPVMKLHLDLEQWQDLQQTLTMQPKETPEQWQNIPQNNSTLTPRQNNFSCYLSQDHQRKELIPALKRVLTATKNQEVYERNEPILGKPVTLKDPAQLLHALRLQLLQNSNEPIVNSMWTPQVTTSKQGVDAQNLKQAESICGQGQAPHQSNLFKTLLATADGLSQAPKKQLLHIYDTSAREAQQEASFLSKSAPEQEKLRDFLSHDPEFESHSEDQPNKNSRAKLHLSAHKAIHMSSSHEDDCAKRHQQKLSLDKKEEGKRQKALSNARKMQRDEMVSSQMRLHNGGKQAAKADSKNFMQHIPGVFLPPPPINYQSSRPSLGEHQYRTKPKNSLFNKTATAEQENLRSSDGICGQSGFQSLMFMSSNGSDDKQEQAQFAKNVFAKPTNPS